MSVHKHFTVPALLLAGAAQGQEAPGAPQQLEEIVVTASPLGRGADELVQPAQVLDAQELARRRRGTLGETLEGEPGVSSADFGPGAGRPVIRGQGGPRVSILENGIGAMDASTLSADHAVGVDPAGAEQVEIIKGPATLMFGSGASAGVINVVNNRIPSIYEEGWSGEVESALSDNAGEASGRAHVDLGSGGFMFHADGASRVAGDIEIPGAARRTLPNSAARSASGAFGFSRIVDDGMLGAAYSEFHTRYELPNEETAFIELDQQRVDVEARLDDPLPGLESIKLRAGHNDYTHTEFEAPGVAGTRFFNDETELRLQGVHRLGAVRGALGMQLVDRDFEAIGEEAYLQPVRTRSQGVFWVAERPFERGRVELGLRAERQTHDPAVSRIAATHTPLSASAGLLLEFGEQHHARLNVSRAQRAPAAEELFAFGPHLASGTFERGDAGFTEETAQTVELGVDRHDARWTWSAAVFYNAISDYVFQQEVDANRNADGSLGGDADGVADGAPDTVDADGAFVSPDTIASLPEVERAELFTLVDYRQADARFYGLELQTGYELLQGPIALKVELFGDVVRGRLADGGNLPRVTPARYGLAIEGETGAWGFGLRAARTARQSRISSLETPTDGYTMVSADLSYRGMLGVLSHTLYLRGRNLLDEDARRHTSFLKDVAPLPGRAIEAGVRVDF